MDEIAVIYCGCWNQVGHYEWLNGKSIYNISEHFRDCPWPILDSGKLEPGTTHGDAWLTHKGGWTCLGITDNSVDSRPGSRAVFAVNLRDLNLEEMMKRIQKVPMYSMVIQRIRVVNVIKEINE